MSSFLFVGLGGAVGSMLRYGVSRIPFRGSFPVATLLVNLLGAVLIGYVTGMARSRQAPENLVLFLKTAAVFKKRQVIKIQPGAILFLKLQP